MNNEIHGQYVDVWTPHYREKDKQSDEHQEILITKSNWEKLFKKWFKVAK